MKMKRILITFLIISVGALFLYCNKPKDEEVLVKVGNSKITEAELNDLANINPRLKAQLSTEFGRKKILQNLIDQELLYLAAEDKNLDDNPEVKDKIKIYKKVIISQAYLEDKLEELARKYYEDQKDEFETIKMSHILIKTKGKGKKGEKQALDLANKIKKRIEGGEDFAEVAKDVSEDKITKKRGGELGHVARNEQRLQRRGYGPLIEKGFTLKESEIAGPIKTDDGYHIIKVTEELKQQPFEEVKQNILFKIKATARNDILEELRNEYGVEYISNEKDKINKSKDQNKGDKPAGSMKFEKGEKGAREKSLNKKEKQIKK